MQSITCALFNGDRAKPITYFFIEIHLQLFNYSVIMYSQLGSAVKKVFSSDSVLENNNILETTHHSKPIFEKINPDKYFRLTVRMTITKAFFNRIDDSVFSTSSVGYKV